MKQRLTRGSKNCRLVRRNKSNIQSVVSLMSVLRTWIHAVLVFCPLVLHFLLQRPLQSTLLLNLNWHIFGWTPFGWLRNWTLPEEYESHGAEQNLQATHSLQITSPYASSLLQTMLFICTDLSLYFYLQTPRWRTQSRNHQRKRTLILWWIIAAIILTVVICMFTSPSGRVV